MNNNFSEVIAIVGNVIMTSSKNAANQISEKSNSILREVKMTCISNDDCNGTGKCINGVCSNSSNTG